MTDDIQTRDILLQSAAQQDAAQLAEAVAFDVDARQKKGPVVVASQWTDDMAKGFVYTDVLSGQLSPSSGGMVGDLNVKYIAPDMSLAVAMQPIVQVSAKIDNSRLGRSGQDDPAPNSGDTPSDRAAPDENIAVSSATPAPNAPQGDDPQGGHGGQSGGDTQNQHDDAPQPDVVTVTGQPGVVLPQAANAERAVDVVSQQSVPQQAVASDGRAVQGSVTQNFALNRTQIDEAKRPGVVTKPQISVGVSDEAIANTPKSTYTTRMTGQLDDGSLPAQSVKSQTGNVASSSVPSTGQINSSGVAKAPASSGVPPSAAHQDNTVPPSSGVVSSATQPVPSKSLKSPDGVQQSAARVPSSSSIGGGDEGHLVASALKALPRAQLDAIIAAGQDIQSNPNKQLYSSTALSNPQSTLNGGGAPEQSVRYLSSNGLDFSDQKSVNIRLPQADGASLEDRIILALVGKTPHGHPIAVDLKTNKTVVLNADGSVAPYVGVVAKTPPNTSAQGASGASSPSAPLLSVKQNGSTQPQALLVQGQAQGQTADTATADKTGTSQTTGASQATGASQSPQSSLLRSPVTTVPLVAQSDAKQTGGVKATLSVAYAGSSVEALQKMLLTTDVGAGSERSPVKASLKQGSGTSSSTSSSGQSEQSASGASAYRITGDRAQTSSSSVGLAGFSLLSAREALSPDSGRISVFTQTPPVSLSYVPSYTFASSGYSQSSVTPLSSVVTTVVSLPVATSLPSVHSVTTLPSSSIIPSFAVGHQGAAASSRGSDAVTLSAGGAANSAATASNIAQGGAPSAAQTAAKFGVAMTSVQSGQATSGQGQGGAASSAHADGAQSRAGSTSSSVPASSVSTALGSKEGGQLAAVQKGAAQSVGFSVQSSSSSTVSHTALAGSPFAKNTATAPVFTSGQFISGTHSASGEKGTVALASAVAGVGLATRVDGSMALRGISATGFLIQHAQQPGRGGRTQLKASQIRVSADIRNNKSLSQAQAGNKSNAAQPTLLPLGKDHNRRAEMLRRSLKLVSDRNIQKRIAGGKANPAALVMTMAKKHTDRELDNERPFHATVSSIDQKVEAPDRTAATYAVTDVFDKTLLSTGGGTAVTQAIQASDVSMDNAGVQNYAYIHTDFDGDVAVHGVHAQRDVGLYPSAHMDNQDNLPTDESLETQLLRVQFGSGSVPGGLMRSAPIDHAYRAMA